MSEFLASLPPVLVCLIICAAKIVEISIQSLKTCMMVKGQRLKAAGLGFIECAIWGLVISTIIGTLGDNLFLLLFYCIGYATGLFLGSTVGLTTLICAFGVGPAATAVKKAVNKYL